MWPKKKNIEVPRSQCCLNLTQNKSLRIIEVPIYHKAYPEISFLASLFLVYLRHGKRGLQRLRKLGFLLALFSCINFMSLVIEYILH